MKILIAEDDYSSRLFLQTTLQLWGYDVLPAADGDEAWKLLRKHQDIMLAIFDWMIPGFNGIELIRLIRNSNRIVPPYILMLTAKANKGDVIMGLESGADDYMIKPFNREELKARLHVGSRTIRHQCEILAITNRLQMDDYIMRNPQLYINQQAFR